MRPLNNNFQKGTFSSFVKSPFHARNNDTDSYGVWGWRFRQLCHSYLDANGILGSTLNATLNPFRCYLTDDERITETLYRNYKLILQDLRDFILEQVRVYYTLDNRVEGGKFCKNKTPLNTLPYDRNLCLRVEASSVVAGSEDFKNSAILKDIGIGIIDESDNNLTKWSNYTTVGTIVPDWSATDSSYIVANPEIFTGGDIALYELEKAYEYLLRFFLDFDDTPEDDYVQAQNYHRGSSGRIFEISGIVCPAYETPEEAWVYRENVGGFYVESPTSPVYYDTNPLLFNSIMNFGYWRVCSPFSPYLPRYNSDHIEGTRRLRTQHPNYNKHYSRERSANCFFKSTTSQNYNAFNTPLVSEDFALWDTIPMGVTDISKNPNAYVDKLVQVTLPTQPYLTYYAYESLYLNYQINVAIVNFLSKTGLSEHNQKLATNCPYCNTFQFYVEGVTEPPGGRASAPSIIRKIYVPYGSPNLEAVKEQIFKIYCWANVGGDVTFDGWTNVETEFAGATVPEGEGSFGELKIISNLTIDSDTLPQTVGSSYADVSANYSLPEYFMNIYEEYVRCTFYVEESDLIVTPESITRIDNIVDDYIDIFSSINYGRIKYAVTLHGDTFFSVDKSGDDVAYTGSTIDSRITVSFSSGLAPGVYLGDITIDFTGATIVQKVIPIQLTIT